MTVADEAIRAENVVKTFGTITALAGVSLSVGWGETLGILGDNGAGKSTLIKILTGYHQPDSGQVYVDGRSVELGSVDEARALGIECVYQDLALVNGLSVYHNMFLNRELLRWGPFKLLDHRAMRRRSAEALAEIGVDVASVETEVGALSGGQRQAIAVARGALQCAHSAARRAACGDGGARGAAHHRAHRAPEGPRRYRDRDDRAQLRANA
jgi:simple sugar transport system ATP-binding protein